jgi:iron complex outermembrane recepter protein
MKKLLMAGIGLLLSTLAFSQVEIKGKVTDLHGNPLPGASVVILETRQGTVAGDQGDFLFKIKNHGNYTLRASYVGFEETTAQASLTQGTQSVVINLRMQEQSILLDALTVKSTRAGEKAPFTHSTVKKEELQARNLGQDVPYLLDATPSVVVNSDAGAGIGYTGIRIRGTDPTRINVTINGIPLNDAESQGVFWVDLPDFAASTEDIQIQRGVGTSTNGAGAFGATINLNSGQFHTKPYGEITGTAGSFGTWKSSVQFGSGLLGSPQSAVGSPQSTGFTVDGRLSKITSGGYIDRASVDLKSFYLSGAYFGEKRSLRANVFSGHEITYQAWNGVPAQWVDDEKLRRYNVSGTEKSGEPHDNEVDDYTQTHYQLIYNEELSPNLHLNLTGHYTRGFGFFEQYKADESPVRYLLLPPACPDTLGECKYDYIRRRWLDNHFFGGIAALNFNSNSQRLQATLSGGWNQYLGDHYGEIIWGEYLEGAEPGHRYYSGTGDKRDLNVFTKIQYNFTPWLHGFADLQLRRVDYEITGNDNDLRETNLTVDYNFFNPKAGVLYDLNEKTTAYASFAVANREPNRSDFTDAAEGMQPRPERLLNTEAGVRHSSGGRAFGVNFYHMQYRDQLVLTGNINDVGAPIRTNVPGSYRLGVELTGAVSLTKKLTLDANATFSQNKIKNFTEYIDNWDTWGQEVVEHGTTDIAFSPNLIAFGRLSYDFLKNENQQLTIALAGKHVGKQYIDNTSNENTVLDAYTTGELQIRYILKPKFVEELSLNLLINNLFDARYSANAWTYRYISASYDGRPDDPYTRLEGGDVYNLTGFYPQAGRNFLLGVTVRF